MGKRVAVLIKDPKRHHEGLRFSLGLLLEAHTVHLAVLNHPLRASEELLDNMGFIDEMGGERASNHPDNVARHGFQPQSLEQLAARLPEFDVVVPF
jgi:hypothetical protein